MHLPERPSSNLGASEGRLRVSIPVECTGAPRPSIAYIALQQTGQCNLDGRVRRVTTESPTAD